jgi:glutamyl-tRNA synthetase
MSLPELVENVGIVSSSCWTRADDHSQFDLSALTHRRTVLDPTKLERLNQQHLTRLWADESSRQVLAERLVPVVQDAFPDRSDSSAPSCALI